MKKKMMFLAMILCLSIVSSCSKDDDNKTSLEGKWEYQLVGTLIGNNEILEDYEHTPDCSKDYMELLSNGVLKNFSYEMNGFACQEMIEVGTWNRAQSNISLTSEDEITNAEILTLTNTILKIKTSFYDEEDDTTFIFIIQFKRK
jgi:hypothetical protein